MINRFMRFLGVALLVAAGFSAGLRHAHPGGDQIHDHHDAFHRADAQFDDHASAAVAGWFATPLHMHIFLLGFQFTLPATGDADDVPSDEGNDLVVVRLIGDDLSDSVARPPLVAYQLMVADPGLDLGLAVIDPVFEPVYRPRALPLCDTARHERSGVQLA